MENMFDMFSFAFWVIRALKCEAVNFVKFKSAGVPIRPFEYLDTIILIIACAPCTYVRDAPCTYVRDAHAHRDITRFAYDVNHITMMSPAFVFHSCHIDTRRHDIIGAHVVGTPCDHGTHRMAMT